MRIPPPPLATYYENLAESSVMMKTPDRDPMTTNCRNLSLIHFGLPLQYLQRPAQLPVERAQL